MAETLPCCCAPPLSVELVRRNQSRSQAPPAEEAPSAGDNATAG
jgi:hypothetical protein